MPKKVEMFCFGRFLGVLNLKDVSRQLRPSHQLRDVATSDILAITPEYRESRKQSTRLINTSRRWQNGSSRQCVIRRCGLKRGVRDNFANKVTSAGEGTRFQFASDQVLLVYVDQTKKKGRSTC